MSSIHFNSNNNNNDLFQISSTNSTTTTLQKKRKKNRNIVAVNKKNKIDESVYILMLPEKIVARIFLHLLCDKKKEKQTVLNVSLTCKFFKHCLTLGILQIAHRTFNLSPSALNLDAKFHLTSTESINAITKLLFKYCITKHSLENVICGESLPKLLAFSHLEPPIGKRVIQNVLHTLAENFFNNQLYAPAHFSQIHALQYYLLEIVISKLKERKSLSSAETNVSSKLLDLDLLLLKQRILSLCLESFKNEKNLKKIETLKSYFPPNTNLKEITEDMVEDAILKHPHIVPYENVTLCKNDLVFFIKNKKMFAHFANVNTTPNNSKKTKLSDEAKKERENSINYWKAFAFCLFEFLVANDFETFDSCLASDNKNDNPNNKSIAEQPFAIFEMISSVNGEVLLNLPDSYLEKIDWSKPPICSSSSFYIKNQRSLTTYTKFFSKTTEPLLSINSEFKRLCTQHIHSHRFGDFLKKILEGSTINKKAELISANEKEFEPTALHCICLYSGNKFAAQTLVDTYRNSINENIIPYINQQVCKNLKYTPLHLALIYPKNEELIEYLLTLGADPLIESYNGFNALEFAIIHEKTSYVELLLKHMAIDDKNKRRIFGPQTKTSFFPKKVSVGYLDFACKNQKIMKLLLKHGFGFATKEEINNFLTNVIHVFNHHSDISLSYEDHRENISLIISDIVNYGMTHFHIKPIDIINKLLNSHFFNSDNSDLSPLIFKTLESLNVMSEIDIDDNINLINTIEKKPMARWVATSKKIAEKIINAYADKEDKLTILKKIVCPLYQYREICNALISLLPEMKEEIELLKSTKEATTSKK